MVTAEKIYKEILEMPVDEREKLFIFIARWGFVGKTAEPPKKGLARFCGKWQDERDPDEIIAEIYADRQKNIRSEKVVL